MSLLIITQRVDINDDNLGFFHRWLEEFSQKLDKVYVICLWKGEYHLPENVEVFSMGKERGVSKIEQLLLLQKHLLKILPKVNGVFFHMCPIYVIAGFSLVKIFRKKSALWFLHKNVSWKLKIASKIVDKILTASPESCRLKDRRKIEIVGHGIDTDFFKPGPGDRAKDGKFKIAVVGRISPLKDHETLIEAAGILAGQGITDIEVIILGSPVQPYEEEYLAKLKGLVKEKQLQNCVRFLGGMPQKEVVEFYRLSDTLVNLSPTGGVDKVVLEAMACGLPVLVCNETFRPDLGQYAGRLIFQEKSPQDLADKIVALKNSADRNEIGAYLREGVVKSHNLNNLVDKIISQFI